MDRAGCRTGWIRTAPGRRSRPRAGNRHRGGGRAALDDVDPAAFDGVVAAKAVKPRFGTPLASAFAAPLPFCGFDCPASRRRRGNIRRPGRYMIGVRRRGGVGRARCSRGRLVSLRLSLSLLDGVARGLRLASAHGCSRHRVVAAAVARCRWPDAWFAGAVSLASGAGAASCSATVAVAGLVRPLVASPIAAVAALAVLTGVGGLTGGATVIAAATGCGGLAAAIAAAAVAASAVAVPLLLLLSSFLLSLDDAFAGVADADRYDLARIGRRDHCWSPSGSAREVGIRLGHLLHLPRRRSASWGPVLLLVDARDGVFPPLTAGGLAAPGCGAAAAVPLIGVAAGSEPSA